MAKQRYFFTNEFSDWEVCTLDDLRRWWEEWGDMDDSFPHYVECVQTCNNGIYEEITNRKLSDTLRNYKQFGPLFHLCDVSTGEILADSTDLEGKALVCEIVRDGWDVDDDMIYIYIPQEV